MPESSTPCGVLLIDKPAGVTSHDVVYRIRNLPQYRAVKVGHAGTLDPFATGLLLVLIGKATRFQRYLVGLPKGYRATAQLGARSTTLDRDGEITATQVTTDESMVRTALEELSGTYEQTVPMTSAVRVAGERLYRKARRGETIETPSRTVTIKSLELTSFDEVAQRASIELTCSSGTYVRQLVADLGEACGSGAYCDQLERTSIGDFELDQADEEKLIDLSQALGFLQERKLSDEELPQVLNGVAVASHGPTNGRPVRLTDSFGLVAVAEAREGMLKPVTVVGTDS